VSPHIAYVFERFPSFTQTFCVREIEQLQRLGVRPLIFSIRDTRDEAIRHFPDSLMQSVHFLPARDELIAKVKEWKDDHSLSRAAALTLRHWGDQPDKARVYEAAYIAKVISDMGSDAPRHVHSHFAGVGARTCWWLRKFSGMSYSFTAHANDIFCAPEAVPLPFESLFRDASLIVTVSDYTAEQLRQRFPHSAARVQRVYNGMDLAPFQAARAMADRSDSAGGILSVGRLIEKKGYIDLIKACALLRDQGIAHHCRIVGEGPLEEKLGTLILELQLQDHVCLLGAQSLETIRDLLVNHTQIFALACATESDGGKDNLPTVLMEAMAASLPCVSTRLAGVPEMVMDGHTGLLCDEGDVPALAANLRQLLGNPTLCASMGEAGLLHAQRCFSREVTGLALLTAYASRSNLRVDAALQSAQPWIAPLLRRRWWRSWSRELRLSIPKVHGKSFDLAAFMAQ
jgi:colanic acid/amylovoran biosynthesis glycosyltransferase